MKIAFAIAAAVIILVMSAAGSGAADQVSISGKVTNGTQGAALEPGLQITIAHLDPSGAELSRTSTTTTGEGSFKASMDHVPGSHFVIATTYKGVTYSTVADQGDTSDISVALTVYETTDDDDVVRVDSDTITVIKGKQDTLEVLQLYKLVNTSDRTYIGKVVNDAPRVVDLPVAVGATSLSPGEGITPERVVTYEDGISSGDPLQPGHTTISFVYKVRVPRSGWSMSRTVAYPTTHIDLLVGPGLNVSAPGFKFQESKVLGGNKYKRFRIGSSEPGALIDGTITDDAGSSKGLVFGLAAGLSAITAITLGTVLFKKQRPTVPEEARKTGRALVAEREELVREIAMLDERFDAGDLAAEEYEATRANLKSRLLELTEEAPSITN